ncbi:hypothetical protein CTEN210_11215 [Chaetoceros tenuissimus]|uniref:Circumsporozoite protein n=1 Tax=Chaetoceros tenuissimus TaxID=426638 RepID=A0AAD3H9C0_9STRA|nr:hypothetical protein CTEN210_11215 [Chaetoceros tenuissimus]
MKLQLCYVSLFVQFGWLPELVRARNIFGSSLHSTIDEDEYLTQSTSESTALEIQPRTFDIACLNSPTFKIDYEEDDRIKTLTCISIRWKFSRREALCPLPEVNEKCAHTCGRCCEDDPDYVLTTNLETLKRCAWVGQKEVRMIRYCDTWNSGRMVRDACPAACNYCFPAIQAIVTEQPSFIPSQFPSERVPSASPSLLPTNLPTNLPSIQPSVLPSVTPSNLPSLYPSNSPSFIPSSLPSFVPSNEPSLTPSISNSPSIMPSSIPSSLPSLSMVPSSSPSVSNAPSTSPSTSSAPSDFPSNSNSPSSSPSDLPSFNPTSLPSMLPSQLPSISPSFLPSTIPSSSPSARSDTPSSAPSAQPSMILSDKPSLAPSISPSKIPSSKPSVSTSAPSMNASETPSVTLHPSSKPSDSPTQIPSSQPSSRPTISCVDDINFIFTLDNGNTQDCNWLTKNSLNAEFRIAKYCPRFEVRNRCRITCDNCDCVDTPREEFKFRIDNGLSRGCEWISRNEDKVVERRQIYCEREYPHMDNLLLKETCPAACGYCVPLYIEYFGRALNESTFDLEEIV